MHVAGGGLLRELLAVAHQLGEDELRVLMLIAKRLRAGRETYGELDLERDRRDFPREALDEVADALVYVACGFLQGGAGE